MIRQNQAFLNRVNIFLDMLLVVFSYMFASWLWLDHFGKQKSNIAAISGKTVLLACAYSLSLFILLSLFGFYYTTRTRRFIWKAKTIFYCVTIMILVVTAILFVFRLEDFSRGVLFIFYCFSLFTLVGKYLIMRQFLRNVRKKGYNLKHVIVIGTGELAKQFKNNIEKEKELGYDIIGFVGKDTFLNRQILVCVFKNV